MELHGISDHENNGFVQKLKAIFEERKEKNKRYSLRAFARDLNIEASLISKIFRGQYKLTSKMILRLGQTLGLSNREIGGFLAENRDGDQRQRFSPIDDEVFRVISTWYYFAVLRSFDLPDIEKLIPCMPQQLGITREEFESCITALKRVGLLTEKNGRLVRSSGQLSTFPCEKTSDANRKVQAEFLEKAILALHEVPIEDRDNTTITFSVDHRLLPEIKEEIARFRKQISYLVANRSSQDTDVYNMSIALYPLLTMRN